MKQPILVKKQFIWMYISFWMLVAAGHFLFNYQVLLPEWWPAAADALVSSFTYALLGLGLWYAVRFSQMDNLDRGTVIYNHMALAALTILLWLTLTYYITQLIILSDSDFREAFENTVFWRALVGLWHYLLLLLVYYLVMYYGNYKHQMQQEAEIKAHLQQAELNILRAQLNPHFLFNSLNSVSALTIEEPHKARKMIGHLAAFLRFTISSGKQQMTTFEKEMEMINNYLEIEKVRFEDRYYVKENIDPSCRDKKLPQLILQPLLENAIKYGVNDRESRVHIGIKAQCYYNLLEVQIENPCAYKKADPLGTGTGLNNIASRMQVTYGRNDLMTVYQKEGIFSVTLKFPQLNYENTHADHR